MGVCQGWVQATDRILQATGFCKRQLFVNRTKTIIWPKARLAKRSFGQRLVWPNARLALATRRFSGRASAHMHIRIHIHTHAHTQDIHAYAYTSRRGAHAYESCSTQGSLQVTVASRCGCRMLPGVVGVLLDEFAKGGREYGQGMASCRLPPPRPRLSRPYSKGNLKGEKKLLRAQ